MNKITAELLEEIKMNNTQIVIYGAGKIAHIVALKLGYEGYHIQCHVVTSLKNNPFYIYEKPVIAIGELHKGNYIILVCMMECKQDEIETLLKEYDFSSVYGISDALCEQWDKDVNEIKKTDKRWHYFKRYIEPYEKTLCNIAEERALTVNETKKYLQNGLKQLNDEKIHIPRLVVVLGTKCSLRCKECNNLMPHFKPQQDLDIETIIKSLNVLTANIGTVLKCELIGGEPFLSKNLKTALEYVIHNQAIDSIEITTNGTVIPQENVIPLLKNSKVLVRISDYGKQVNKEKILCFLDENNIKYTILDLGNWVSPGGIEKRNRDEETLCKYYERCPSGYYCKTLYEDKVFACARAASLFALGYMKEQEYVRVDNTLETECLKEFMLRKFSVACDYCDITIDNKEYVQPAEQMML